ncbi:MAG: hypothetical protein FJ264_15575 [Planctomycetes bacterium]|nr:hypothetical protein [Planctomycetota bacterium]
MAEKCFFRKNRMNQQSEINLPIQLEVEGDVYSANSIDLRESGLCCVTDEYIPSLTRLKLKLTLPVNNETVESTGMIVRVKNGSQVKQEKKTYRTDIFFDDIDPREQGKIQKYLMEMMSA